MGPAGSWLQLLPLPLPNCGGLNISHAWGPHFSVYHMAVSYCISACSRIFKGPPQAKGGMRSNQVGNDHSVHSPSLCSHILDFNVLCSAKKKKKSIYMGVCMRVCAVYSIAKSCLTLCNPMVKNLPANAGDKGLIPGSERSPREGNGNPPQCSCLGNPIDRETWQLQSMGSQKSQTGRRVGLNNNIHTHTHTHTHTPTPSLGLPRLH